ncbi:acyl carrier protein [Allostreptomyces psammosilenae]|uniref:Acyl carrier protein n=1 Tax=Allostreptomyces psammosilenae TaxID=1892865 RepID=A0A853A312_9ACTN|nr:acyl carrier protein [Allostreptomyces psammosilenae]NYI04902.1 acyl carrier protein [Allostreptomyces psammosilenae]
MSEQTTDIQEFLISTLGERFRVPAAKLSAGARLSELGLDSLGTVELGMVVKKKYGAVFSAGEISIEFTVGDVAELIGKKVAEAEVPAS